MSDMASQNHTTNNMSLDNKTTMTIDEKLEQLNRVYTELLKVNNKGTFRLFMKALKIKLSKAVLELTEEEIEEFSLMNVVCENDMGLIRSENDELLRLQLKHKIAQLEQKRLEGIVVSEPAVDPRLMNIISHIGDTKPYLRGLFECLKGDEQSLHLFYGDVQAGKTTTCLFNAYMSVAMNKSVIIFTQNKICHRNQMLASSGDFKKKKLDTEFKYMEKKYGKLPTMDSVLFDTGPIPFTTIRDDENKISGRKMNWKQIVKLCNKKDTPYTKQINKWVRFLNPKSSKCGVIIVNTNSCSLSLLWDAMKKLKTKCNIIIDEIDKLFADKTDDSRKMNTYLQKIMACSNTISGTTATPLKLFMNSNSGLSNVIEIPRVPNYVSLNDITWETKTFEKSKSVPYSRKVFDVLENLGDFIYQEHNKAPLEDIKVDGKTHTFPNITAIVVSESPRHHQEIHKHIRTTTYIEPIVSIVWNGEGLWFYSSVLKKDKNSKVWLLASEPEGILMESKSRGEFYIDTNKHTISIQHMLDYLREHGGYKVFGNIFITGGQYFDRAINYADNKYLWHITKQLLLLSDQCPGDKMIQYCRILGIYRDKGQYTPTIVTSQKIKEKINKAYTMVRISSTEMSKSESSSIKNFLTNCSFAGVLKTTGKMFNVAKGVNIPTKLDTNRFSMDGNDVANWGLFTENKFITEQHHKLYTQKNGYKNQVEGLVRKQEFTKKCKDLGEATLDNLRIEVGKMEIDVKTKKKKTYTQLEKINKYLSGKKNTAIGVFLASLQVDKIYSKEEILLLLEQATYKQPLSMFSSITKQNSTYGPGCIFEKHGLQWKIMKHIANAWIN